MTSIVAFFNTALRAGTTTLTYHVAWMLRELGTRVLVGDPDPQANLASFLADDAVESLWQPHARKTVYGALAPLFEGEGGIVDAHVVPIDAGAHQHAVGRAYGHFQALAERILARATGADAVT